MARASQFKLKTYYRDYWSNINLHRMVLLDTLENSHT